MEAKVLYGDYKNCVGKVVEIHVVVEDGAGEQVDLFLEPSDVILTIEGDEYVLTKDQG